MKLCLTCRAVYDDKQQFCKKDGSPLLDIANLATNQESRSVKGVISRRRIVGIAAVVVVALLALGVVYALNRRSTAPVPEKIAAPSPEQVNESRQPTGDHAPRPPKSRAGYFVIGLSSRERADAAQEMERRNQAGYHTQVAYSSDWSDLSPGFYVLVYGVFDTMAEATAAANGLKARNVEVYVKYSGSPKTDAAAPTPGGETGQPDAAPVGAIDPAGKTAATQSDAAGEEAIGEVMKLWEQHFTKCGDSYVSLDSNDNLRQLRGVGFVLSRRDSLTKADELKGWEWSGQVRAAWNAWRRARRRDSAWVWGDWKDSPQSFTFNVSKKNSRWSVTNVIYDQKKIECPALP